MSEPQILAGAEFVAGVLGTVAGGRRCWNDMSSGNGGSCVCVCLLEEGNGYGGGQRTVSSQRAHERQNNLRNGQKHPDSKKSIRTFLPSGGEKPSRSPASMQAGLLQQQPTGPLARGESPRLYSLHSSSSKPQALSSLEGAFHISFLLKKHQQPTPEVLEQRLLPGGDRTTLECWMLQPTWGAEGT